MEVKIMLVKRNGTEQTEIAFDDLSKEEQKNVGMDLKRRFFEILGYVEKSEPPAQSAGGKVIANDFEMLLALAFDVAGPFDTEILQPALQVQLRQKSECE